LRILLLSLILPSQFPQIVHRRKSSSLFPATETKGFPQPQSTNSLCAKQIPQLEFHMYSNFLWLVYALCMAGTLLLCFAARPICARLNIIDHPVGRKQHSKPTPLMGGLVVALVAVPLSYAITMFALPGRLQNTAILYVSAIWALALLGTADDRHNMSPRLRLIFSILVFAVVASVDQNFMLQTLMFEYPHFGFSLGGFPLNLLFTVFSCVALINAVNMADGKNGLVIGLFIGWLLLLSTKLPTDFLPLVWLPLSCLIVLYVFNMRGHIFLGDGGAYGFACATGLLAIAAYNSPGVHVGHAISADQIAILFIVPILDGGRLIVSRSFKGQSPMDPDNNHLHHILHNRFGWPGGLLVYYLIALGPAAILFAL
jgi:UDP-GlcNAc:undecaprenyl-phosphate/decaprenyl-phosphate GlcNAc-1-phosphate transferase